MGVELLQSGLRSSQYWGGVGRFRPADIARAKLALARVSIQEEDLISLDTLLLLRVANMQHPGQLTHPTEYERNDLVLRLMS